jgi:hypothetical protein
MHPDLECGAGAPTASTPSSPVHYLLTLDSEQSRLCCVDVLNYTCLMWGRRSASEAHFASTLYSWHACNASQAEILSTVPLIASLGERHAGTALHALQQSAGLLSCLVIKQQAAHTLSKDLKSHP